MARSNNNKNRSNKNISRIPSFLVECDSGRRSECRNHAVDRAFDLLSTSVSLESLSVLAFTQLLTFLLQDPQRNVVWLSEDVYLADNSAYLCCNYSFTVDLGESVSGCVCLCLSSKSKSHHDNNNNNDNNSSSSSAVMNTFLRLLVHCNSIVSIKVYQGRYNNNYYCLDRQKHIHTPFPASLEALETFVSQASSARTLYLDAVGLTLEQWRVIIFHANPNTVKLSIDFSSLMVDQNQINVSSDSVMALLVQAMRMNNQGPAKLELRSLHMISCQSVYDFLQALETSTTTCVLKELVVLHGITWEYFIAFCRAISQKNCTLHKLELGGPVNGRNIVMSDTEWDLFCRVLAAHPTLHDITCHLFVAKSSRSLARDQILMKYLSHNKLLSNLRFHEDCFFNDKEVRAYVARRMEAHRFRAKAGAIRQLQLQDTNNTKTRQEHLVYLMLMSPKLDHSPQNDPKRRPLERKNGSIFPTAPTHRYLLLRENSTILAEWARPDKVLYPIWYQVKEQVMALEQEMEQYGMPLPSLKLLLGKKRKASNDDCASSSS